MTDIKFNDETINDIFNKWFRDLYDLEEDGTEDIELILSLLGKQPKKVLEIACGSGRILVPIAKAGHEVFGFDIDDYMMSQIPDKVKGLNNLQFKNMDAIAGDWGNDFDTVIMAGNLLHNIESDLPYQEAQQLFIKKASACLHKDGHLFLDFGMFAKPEEIFAKDDGRIIFQGTDQSGVSGQYICINDFYDLHTHIATGRRHIELTMPDGHQVVINQNWKKHIPTLEQIHVWLHDAGFVIENEYGTYDGQPISEATYRAVIYARKAIND